MESKFKIITFWIFFAFFLACLFIAIFSFLSKDAAGGEVFLAFAFMFVGFLFFMKKRTGKAIIFLILATGLLALGAYVSFTMPQSLDENEQAAVLQYAEPIVNNLLAGLNEKDQSKFTKDLAPGATMDLDPVIKSYGRYISKSEPTVSRVGEAVKLTYSARFEKANSVVLEIIIQDINGKKFITAVLMSVPGVVQ